MFTELFSKINLVVIAHFRNVTQRIEPLVNTKAINNNTTSRDESSNQIFIKHCALLLRVGKLPFHHFINLIRMMKGIEIPFLLRSKARPER